MDSVYKAKIDDAIYQKGIVVSQDELNQIALYRNEFHGKWNYAIKPNNVHVI
ncbi:hypothetical protein AwDysgo_15070 [Bacteroidales bacterium]|nr:hypothetical protein AwDysgo_15070 [Bacteroidales bacterium]